jgi:hypothetical protein
VSIPRHPPVSARQTLQPTELQPHDAVEPIAEDRREGSREARTAAAGDSALAHGMKLTIRQQDVELARLREKHIGRVRCPACGCQVRFLTSDPDLRDVDVSGPPDVEPAPRGLRHISGILAAYVAEKRPR